ncbi:MAG: hypothetical protein DSY32_03275, partial [Aquifex sp.]
MKKAMLLGALFSVALAQEVSLEEIQVIGKREVLTEDVIRELPAKDVGEALENNIPGVWKVRKGAIANDVVIRGFKRDEVNQLFDGARVYNACPNRMDPGIFHVDFSEVEDVEVIKGPFDVRNYGAVGGTVNIKTKEPKKGMEGRITAYADNWNTVNPSFYFSYGREKLSFLIGYAFRFGKPYEDGKGRKITEVYPSGNPSAYSQDEKNSTAFNLHTTWAKFRYKINEGIKLKLDYAHQRATDVLYPYLMMDAISEDIDRVNLGLEGKRFRVQIYGSSVRHWMTNQKRVISENTPRGYSMGTYAKSKVYGFKGEYNLGSFSVGIDTFYRYWEAQTSMYMKTMGVYKTQNTIPDVDLYNFGLYGEYRKKLSQKLKIVAGLRLDWTKTKADSNKAHKTLYKHYHQTADTSETDIYPSGNVQVFYTLKEGIELFAGLGSAVRVPDPQERYFALDRMGNVEKMMGDWVGNPKLKPERNNELDLGMKFMGSR